MPIKQTVTLILPTYNEVRESFMRSMIDNTPSWGWPSPMGLSLVAYFQQDASKEMDWFHRREALLAARAKFSIVRHLYKVYEAEGIDPYKRKSA